MCAHIIPRSVNSYLSGICNQLEPFFPEVRANRNSALVSCTLAGCMRRFGTPVVRKRPITEDDIVLVIADIGASRLHDDLLFLSMLTNGRDRLQRLGEMTIPDSVTLRNARKLTLRRTVLEAGVPPDVIQAIGRWASDAFQIYIRKNPVFLQAMLFGRPVHQPPAISPA
jgi:hypothetical protein